MNLRKASALQLAIREQIAAADLKTITTIGRYDSPIELTQKALMKFSEELQKTRALLTVLYGIRKKLANASEAAGVSDLLAEMAHLDKTIELLKPLSELKDFARTNEMLEEARTDLRKETTQEAHYPYNKRESFTVSVIPEAWTTEYKKEIAELRKKKQALSEQLLNANVKNEIKVSEEEEALLKRYDIL
jgi:hypothetical protein